MHSMIHGDRALGLHLVASQIGYDSQRKGYRRFAIHYVANFVILREERIKKALLAGTNFDEKYKSPTRTEQVTAWDAYLKSPAQQQAQQPVASNAESTRQKPAGPVPSAP